MTMRIWIVLGVMAGVAGMALPAGAQSEADNDAEKARDYVYRSWPVDDMIRQAAENVARRYNLNPEQTAFTRDMMAKRVNAFLRDNEDQIWPVLRDMMRYQNPNRKMDAQTAQRLGRAIRPIFEEAQREILAANSEWRDILSDEQKELHDYDRKQMDKTFQDMDNRFAGWANGKVDNQQGIFPAERPDTPPVNPRQPKPTEISAAKVLGTSLEWWDGYVQAFIENYELDEGQINAAKSILKELKERASAHEKSHAAELKAVEDKIRDARRAKDVKKLDAAMTEKRQASQYKVQLFEELKTRLDTIPRPAQKQKYAEKIKSFRWKNRPGFPDEPAAEPTSRPATTTPAATEKPVPTTQPAAEVEKDAKKE
ncbi:MAG: hypothetical protein JXB13_18010 [Phycisphaerae bacterium]|nr:hypothetical protein [Phycisphaerae bacterium]